MGSPVPAKATSPITPAEVVVVPESASSANDSLPSMVLSFETTGATGADARAGVNSQGKLRRTISTPIRDVNGQIEPCLNRERKQRST